MAKPITFDFYSIMNIIGDRYQGDGVDKKSIINGFARFAEQVAHHESRQRNISQTGGGLGRGFFQYEKGGIEIDGEFCTNGALTAVNRALQFCQQNNLAPPSWLTEMQKGRVGDFTQLSQQQQMAIFAADYYAKMTSHGKQAAAWLKDNSAPVAEGSFFRDLGRMEQTGLNTNEDKEAWRNYTDRLWRHLHHSSTENTNHPWDGYKDSTLDWINKDLLHRIHAQTDESQIQGVAMPFPALENFLYQDWLQKAQKNPSFIQDSEQQVLWIKTQLLSTYAKDDEAYQAALEVQNALQFHQAQWGRYQQFREAQIEAGSKAPAQDWVRKEMERWAKDENISTAQIAQDIIAADQAAIQNQANAILNHAYATESQADALPPYVETVVYHVDAGDGTPLKLVQETFLVAPALKKMEESSEESKETVQNVLRESVSRKEYGRAREDTIPEAVSKIKEQAEMLVAQAMQSGIPQLVADRLRQYAQENPRATLEDLERVISASKHSLLVAMIVTQQLDSFNQSSDREDSKESTDSTLDVTLNIVLKLLGALKSKEFARYIVLAVDIGRLLQQRIKGSITTQQLAQQAMEKAIVALVSDLGAKGARKVVEWGLPVAMQAISTIIGTPISLEVSYIASHAAANVAAKYGAKVGHEIGEGIYSFLAGVLNKKRAAKEFTATKKDVKCEPASSETQQWAREQGEKINAHITEKVEPIVRETAQAIKETINAKYQKVYNTAPESVKPVLETTKKVVTVVTEKTVNVVTKVKTIMKSIFA